MGDDFCQCSVLVAEPGHVKANVGFDRPAAVDGIALAAGNESQDEDKDARECPSDGALVAEDPAYRNKVDNSFNSNARKSFKFKLLHSCSFPAFLKAIFDECARLFCSGIISISSDLDLTDFVESSADLCKKHQADICAIINNSGDSLPLLSQSGECEPHLSRVLSQSGDMHDLDSLQHSLFDEQFILLSECVRKVIWCKIITFLHDIFFVCDDL